MSTDVDAVQTVPDSVPDATPCRCHHGAGHHRHYRSGTDCSRCRCRDFRPAGRNRIWVRLGHGLRRSTRTRAARRHRKHRPGNPHLDDGITALLDAIADRVTTCTSAHDQNEVIRWDFAASSSRP